MKKNISIQIETDYNLFGVDTLIENEIIGVIRMSGRYRRSNNTLAKIRGMCVPFQFNSLDKKIEISPDHPFYYGDQLELMVYFNNKVPFDLKLYQDEENPLLYGESIYYSIPMERLNCNDTRQEVVKKSIENLSEAVPELFNQMRRYTLDDDEYSRRQFGQRVKCYPLFLKEQAIENKAYYSSKISLENRKKKIIELPNVRIFSTPFGGFKGWKERAKRIMSKKYQ